LSSDDCEDLHKEAKRIGLGHKMFSRPLSGQCNILVQALDSILSEMGDESNVVEYWTRQEWRSIEAHADVDEFLAKSQDASGNIDSSDFRYPKNGHVLYLKVGTEVRGPTLVFPGKSSAKDLLKSRCDNNEKDEIDFVIVPAVSGRLLRFPGEALHAVPRPADLWLQKFIQGAAKYEPEEEWGRSVILFNTWDDAPMNVPADTPSDGEVEIPTVCKDNWKSKVTSIFGNSKDTGPDTGDEVEMVTAKVWLLGNLRRRAHAMRTLKVAAPASISTALHEVNDVSHLLLHPMDQ